MEIEEDTYSSIFQALKHPIRRRILRMLKEKPSTYTEILNELGVDNGLLNYHLENLKGLLAKGEDEQYRLSDFGEAGLSLIEKVETPKNSMDKQGYFQINTLPNLLIVLLLFTSAILNGYYYIGNQNLKDEINTINTSYSKLQQNYIELLERYDDAEKKLEYYPLWNGEIELVNPRFGYQRNHADVSKYVAVATKLDSMLRTGKIDGLEDVFVYHYPDWVNGTAYVVLSDLSPEFTEPILDLFSPSISENIRFLEAPAPPVTLERWRNKLLSLCIGELKNRGVNWTAVGTYYNGKILLGVEKITPDTVDIIIGVVRGEVPPGVIVIEETGPIELYSEIVDLDTPVELLVDTFTCMISQMNDPDHDWESDPAGPKVKSIDILYTTNELSIKTIILTDPEGRFYRLFPVEERVPGPIWDYNAPKPVNVTGLKMNHTGINNQTVEVIYVYDVEYSDIGEWVTGVLSQRNQTTGSFTYYNKTYSGNFNFLTLITEDEELVLASHEGYVYDVPICGTGQPIAECGFNETVLIRGLKTVLTDSNNKTLPIFMVFDVNR